jgi:hypothetical protein
MPEIVDTVFWWVGAIVCGLGAVCGFLLLFWLAAGFIVNRTDSIPVLFDYAVHRKRFHEWRKGEGSE